MVDGVMADDDWDAGRGGVELGFGDGWRYNLLEKEDFWGKFRISILKSRKRIIRSLK